MDLKRCANPHSIFPQALAHLKKLQTAIPFLLCKAMYEGKRKIPQIGCIIHSAISGTYGAASCRAIQKHMGTICRANIRGLNFTMAGYHTGPMILADFSETAIPKTQSMIINIPTRNILSYSPAGSSSAHLIPYSVFMATAPILRSGGMERNLRI